jgi:putative FmdB family regulatory protein
MEEPVPTYQYACTACDHQLEAVQSFADDPLTQCPVCDGRLRKLFGSVGIVFKGPGFYRTDSRTGSNGNGAGKGGSGSGDKSEKSDKSPATKESSSAGSKDSGGGGKDKVGSGTTAASTAASS